MYTRIRHSVALWVLLLAIAGCQKAPLTSPQGEPLIPSGKISISTLAQRLGLRVTDTTDTHVTLKDAGNTVMIFTFSDGQVYVNTKPIAKTGKVEKRAGVLYLDESLISTIRSAMKAGPIYTRPRKPTGTVIIDAGHGGKDPGATSRLGYYEKSVNLQIATRVASLLRRKELNVVMTRDTDTFIELEDRADVGNRNNADLFVSIHADSISDASIRGFTIYIARSAPWSSYNAAQAVSRAMAAVSSARGIQRANYRVLVHSRGPAVLIEVGYLSNRQDAALLTDSSYQNRLAQVIADGISDFLS